MAGKRIYKVAEEMNAKNNELMDFLKERNIEFKSHMSSISDEVIEMIHREFKPAEAGRKEPSKDAPVKKGTISAVYNPSFEDDPVGHQKMSKRVVSAAPEKKNPPKPAGRPGVKRPAVPNRFIPVKAAQPQAKPVGGEDEKKIKNEEDIGKAVEKETVNQQPAAKEAKPRVLGPTGEKVVIPVDERAGNRKGGSSKDDKQRKKIYTTKNDRNRSENSGSGSSRNEGNRNNTSGNKNFAGKAEQSKVAANDDNSSRGKGRKGKDKRDQREFDKNSRHAEQLKNLEKSTGYKQHRKAAMTQEQREEKDSIKEITLPEHMTIGELARRLKVTASDVIKKLFEKGQMYTMNSDIAFDEAEKLALEFNFIATQEEKVDVIAELLKDVEDPEDSLVTRPPVVCVMGHVDHGKTSLLDAIRNTKVTDREAGGITQAIGAYMVDVDGRSITFIDTPGHEAFTAMRMRGANSTDIAILVVAADDGVMPQTVEAINHARAAGVEIIVAINKIDKPSANIDRVKQELSEYELIPEDWGGSTVFCPVSAHTKEGLDNLLEMILLTADVLELRSNPDRNARGLIIEAELDKGRGAVATVLVQKGTLRVGQPVACGSSYGKIRAMIDDMGRSVKEATPSTPVEILGLNSVPDAGEIFVALDSEKEAKAFADTYIAESKNKLVEESRTRLSLDDLFSQIQSGNVKELNIIVKADVQGSVEAVKQSLVKLSNDEVVVKVIHGGVGAINESDVVLASASNAIIIGFNVRPDVVAKATADREGVDLRLYKVIYNAIEDVENAMKGMLDPIFEEKIIGHAEIRQIFKASGIGNIAGSYVLDGYFERGCKLRIRRGDELIYEGEMASLKRFKDDVKEVKAGYECGIVAEGFGDYEEFDIIEAYKMVEVAR